MQDLRVLARFGRRFVQTLRWRVVGLFVLGVLGSVTAGVGIVLLLPLLSLIGVDAGSGSTAMFVDFVQGAFERLGVEPTAGALLALNAAILIFAAGLNLYRAIYEPKVYEAFNASQRNRLFRVLTEARWRHSVNERAADNTHLLTSEVNRMGSAAHEMVGLISQVLMVVVHLVVAIVLSPLLTALVAVAGVVLTVVTQPLAMRAKSRGREVSQTYRRLYGAISEHLNGLKTIKAHGLEGPRADEFEARTAEAAQAVVGVSRNHASVGFLLRAGTAVALSVIIWVALSLPSVTPAGLLVLIYLFSRLVPMLTSLQRSFQSILSKTSAIELFEEAVAKFEGEREWSQPARAAPKPRGVIELRDVWFEYQVDGDKPALRGVDLVVPVGKTTAIVGPSGGGKSTLADLLIGLLSPDRGRLLVDGVELVDEDRLSWRQRVSYVSQDIFMFHTTVRENLLVANPNASDDDLWRALGAASAGFVEDLPERLDTVVGERGVKLSGGERQRLALARALLREPDLLVLDEATSNLDSINEARVQEAVKRLHGQVTLVIIAHRLTTVRDADTIYVMEDGRIVESGTWLQLGGAPDGVFRGLAAAQGLEVAG